MYCIQASSEHDSLSFFPSLPELSQFVCLSSCVVLSLPLADDDVDPGDPGDGRLDLLPDDEDG